VEPDHDPLARLDNTTASQPKPASGPMAWSVSDRRTTMPA
jgi:hypothetical protein